MFKYGAFTSVRYHFQDAVGATAQSVSRGVSLFTHDRAHPQQSLKKTTSRVSRRERQQRLPRSY